MGINEKATISLKKVIVMTIALLFIMGISVMATGAKLNKVKIIYADGMELDIITSKSKVSEILDENHIVLLSDETVVPKYDDEISDNKTIRIFKSNGEEANVQSMNQNENIEDVLAEYNTVSEKIAKEEVTIPHETEVKDLSTGDGEKVETITQKGKDGKKEIYYKIKLVEGNEEEKTQIAEKVIEEPVNCIKEIRTKRVQPVVTSRSSDSVNDDDNTPAQTENPDGYTWSGKKLTRSAGVVKASESPSGYRETYYNLYMGGCLRLLGLSSDGYGVRSDGVKTYNGYVMVASPNLSKYPYKSYVPTTLGMGYVVDFCPGGSLDIAVTW
ncbi:MAG: G5 domain-containing protein [Clostridia bacterium]|nr:G5 domain-containing protein [Clostridia bacterium]